MQLLILPEFPCTYCYFLASCWISLQEGADFGRILILIGGAGQALCGVALLVVLLKIRRLLKQRDGSSNRLNGTKKRGNNR
jgi:hypothetical protein